MATTTQQSRMHQNTVDAAAAERGSNELVKLIRKLRWIGMEKEAEPLEAELTRRRTAADSVLAMPRETD